MAVTKTSCVLTALVSCFVSAGVVLAVWVFKLRIRECRSVSSTAIVRTTWPVEFHSGLIIRTDHNVYAYSESKLMHLLSNATSYVDCYENKTLYYLSPDANQPIHSTSREHTSIKYRPRDIWYFTSLAVDSLTKKIYVYNQWVNQIEVYDLEWEHVAVVFSEIGDVKDMIVDPRIGVLIILQSSMIRLTTTDGKRFRTIVRYANLTAFAVDLDYTLLYYTKGDRIMVCNYYSTVHHYEVIKIDSPLLGLAVSKGTLYFLSKNTSTSITMLTACKFTTPVTVRECSKEISTIEDEEPRQIKAFDMFNQRSGSNPCKNMNGNCDHLCFILPSYKKPTKEVTCECDLGWQLSFTGTSCLPVKAFLMYARGMYLKGRILDLDKTSFVDVIDPIHLKMNQSHRIDFDFNAYAGYAIYTTESYLLQIYFRRVNGKRLILLDQVLDYEILSPAIDWITEQLYYLRRRVDSYASYLMVRRIDATSHVDQRVIYEFAEDEQPRAMVLVLKFGIIYVTVRKTNDNRTAIYKINTDGSGLVEFLVEAPDFSVSEYDLAFDSGARRLYWFNENRTQVQNAAWTGGTALRTVDISIRKDPLTINVYKGWMYIGYRNTVWQFDKETGENAQDVFPSRAGERDEATSRIKVFDQSLQPVGSENPCFVNNGGCRDFCFAIQSGQDGKLKSVCNTFNSNGTESQEEEIYEET